MASPTVLFTATYIGKSTRNQGIVFGTSYGIYKWDNSNFTLVVNGAFVDVHSALFVTDDYYAANVADIEEPEY